MLRFLAIVWAVILLLSGPLNVALTKRLLAKQRPTRFRAYVSTVRGLGIIALITLVVDYAGGRIGLHYLAALPPTKPLLIWTAGTVVACLAISLGTIFVRRMLGCPPSSLVILLLPRTPGERLAFVGVSLAAGLVEEYVFRGFCMGLLISAMSSELLAFLLVTISFGIGHGYQDFLGIVRATLLGAVLAITVLLTHALLPSILAHAIVDLTAGLPSYYSLLRRWGLAPGNRSAH